MSARPRRKRKVSDAQLRQRTRFRGATCYAKQAIADADMRKLYDERAQKSWKLQTAFNVAVADYMCSPEVKDIDITGYKGCVGDRIIIEATDDFMVKGVKVVIRKDDGFLVEQGDAMLSFNGMNWVYSAQIANMSYEGTVVIVRAFDFPGNVGEEKVVC